jgi:hypothetical protein
LFSVLIWAQNNVATTFPYECSFEEGEDLSAWTLNYGSRPTTDQWIVGTSVHSEGKRSLYISADGQNPNYGKKPNVVVSYFLYKFPTATNTQKYDVSFDWKGMGDSTTSKLYVIVCREQDMFANGNSNIDAIINSPGGRLSNAQIGACQALGESGEKFVCGSEAWQNVSLTNVVSVNAANSSKNFAFIFIWVNSNQQDSIFRTSMAIDNFQINTASVKKPQNLIAYPHCEDSTLIVTWETSGAANEFDIQYRKVGESGWVHGVSGITEGPDGFTRVNGTQCTYILKRILEGSYDVRIRSAFYDPEENKTLRSNYVYESSILVYCPDNHCVNYVDLYGPNVVCTYGKHEKHVGQTPYDSIGVIDYGPDSGNSKHTLHVDPTEVDPRADSLLHTVPEGALASVRLGNWNPDGNAQSITYNIHVDTTTQGILILKYAVVLDNSGHDRDEEPYFRMEILDSLDRPLGDLCGKADFTYSDAVAAAQDLSSWHLTRYQGEELAWKEWTTVGVDLMQYHDQNIKVRITSADCGQWVHFGYGYFTLDCANAHIETENCGNESSVTCMAPDGFAYAWYNENGDTVSHDQTFIVDASRQVYTCRVSFIEEPDCYFEISTTSEPRFPVPEYSYVPDYGECQSKLRFTNTSHVMNKFDGEEHHTSEPCNESLWTFRSLTTGQVRTTTTTNPTYTCRDQGDSVEVTMTVYIGADNSCDSTRVDTIVVPNIVPDNTVFYITTCPEAPVKFGNCADCWYNTDTVVTITEPNFAGCDSTSTLHLTVNPVVADTYVHDSICSDGSITINGVRYNQPLENYLIMLKTPQGCDSAVYLTLTVNQRIQATVDQIPFVCADDEQMFFTFDIAAGVFDSLQILFDSPQLRDTTIYDSSVSSVAIPYADTITPGVYKATLRFYQFCCGVYTEERTVEIRYRSSIVAQKWNDVLTLLSPKYNGGFEFTAFQWYKDGQPLLGETHSYLYQPLDFESTYYVELTRADGLVMTTCPIQPVYHEQQTPYPTIVTRGQQVPMYMDQAVTIWYYTISGQLVTSFGLPQGYTSLPVPEQTGAFIIKSVNTQGETQAQVMIVE